MLVTLRELEHRRRVTLLSGAAKPFSRRSLVFRCAATFIEANSHAVLRCCDSTFGRVKVAFERFAIVL